MAEIDINPIINRVLKRWAPQLEAQISGSAGKKLKRASGKGHSSFNHTVQSAGSGQLARAFFQFMGYLRYYDMRRVNKKQAPIEVYEEWIKSKGGIARFKAGFRRRYKNVPKDPRQLLNRIAWGIARSKKRKRRPWYNQNKEASISDMYTMMLDEVADEVIKAQKAALRARI